MKQKFKLLALPFVGAIMLNSTLAQVTGSGTSAYIPKWNGTTSLTNSQIRDDGTSVGIGIAPGSNKLEVNGDVNISSGTLKFSGATVIKAGGSSKDFFGESAGNYITSGLNNAYYGYSAGWQNTTGSSNTCIGQWANGYNTSGSDNTITGFKAGYYSGSGSANTICGKEAGYGVYNASPYSYNNNSFFGYRAGYSVTTGSDNVFAGHSAGYSITTGYNNINIGFKAGYTGTTASHNVFVGYYSGYSNTTGNGNIAVGKGALQNNTTADQNTAVGYEAMMDNTTSLYNTAVGYRAMENTTGQSNTGLGRYALNGNTSGYSNTGTGMNALNGNTTGYNNTAIGYTAGSNNTTGYNNTCVGYNANVSSGALNNATAIGTGASATATNMMYFGNVNAVLYSNTGVLNASDGRFKENVTENVKGLEFIKKLRPVTYNMNTSMLDDFLIQNMPDSIKSLHKQGMDFTASTAVIHSGFIAQELEQAAQEVGFNSSIVHAPDNESSHYAVNYAEIVVPLVKAVQELSSENDNLKEENNIQDSINTSLQQQLNDLKALISACCTAQSTKSMMQESVVDGLVSHSKDVELSSKNIIVLDQNVPNPFADQTVINYYLPDNSNRAQILFLDQSGKLIKVVDLTEKGQGQLNVFANDLSNGIYTYSLIVDGKTMETKKMVKQ